jgi:hypothetical protein
LSTFGEFSFSRLELGKASIKVRYPSGFTLMTLSEFTKMCNERFLFSDCLRTVGLESPDGLGG